MNKRYQTRTGDASALAVPEQVSVAMDEIAENMREGLLALAVGAGLQVMAQLMEADVRAVCEDVPSSVELRWRSGEHQAALTS